MGDSGNGMSVYSWRDECPIFSLIFLGSCVGGRGFSFCLGGKRFTLKYMSRGAFFKTNRLKCSILWRPIMSNLGPESARALLKHCFFHVFWGLAFRFPNTSFLEGIQGALFLSVWTFKNFTSRSMFPWALYLNIYITIYSIYIYIYVLSAGRIAGERGSCHDMFMIYSFEPYIAEVEYLESYVKLDGK